MLLGPEIVQSHGKSIFRKWAVDERTLAILRTMELWPAGQPRSAVGLLGINHRLGQHVRRQFIHGDPCLATQRFQPCIDRFGEIEFEPLG